jgi:hypothetical protein
MQEFTPVLGPLARNTVREWRVHWQDRFCTLALFGLGLYLAAWTPAAWEIWLGRDYVRLQARAAAVADYDNVRENPNRYIGKTVRWQLMHRDGQGWFYKGDPARPIRWRVPPPEFNTYRQFMTIVGTVGGGDSGGVELSYVGRQGGPMLSVHLPS